MLPDISWFDSRVARPARHLNFRNKTMIYLILSCCLLALASLVSNKLVKSHVLQPENGRKLVHLTLGVSIVAVSYLASKMWVASLVCVALTMVVVARELDLFSSFRKVGRRSMGDIYFLIGALASLILADSHTAFVISILILTLADSSAAIIGKAYGRHKYSALGENKSLEGSATFWLVSALIVGWFVLTGPTVIMGDWILVLVLPPVLTIFEALSPKGIDNLTIPIIATLAINIFV